MKSMSLSLRSGLSEQIALLLRLDALGNDRTVPRPGAGIISEASAAGSTQRLEDFGNIAVVVHDRECHAELWVHLLTLPVCDTAHDPAEA
jgi:hypothetical protein